MSDEKPRRSRFDVTDEPPRRSRFDDRSRSPKRSPAASSPSTLGNASPAATTGGGGSASDAAATIQERLARIKNEINNKVATQNVPTTAPRAGIVAKAAPKASGDIRTQDGDFQKDIEINHLRNRYTLTKGAFQKEIKEQTGADVTTKGVYVPDSNTANATGPPLYLQVTAQSREALDKAVAIIDDEMQKDLPKLVDDRRFRKREVEQVERDEFGRRKWPDERIPIPLEPLAGFNLRAQVVGQNGQYVKYIQGQSGARVQIKGRGSGFIEHETGRESDEQMYLHVVARMPEQLEQGKTLALELLDKVKQEYEKFKQNGGSYGGGGRDRQQHRQGSGSVPPPPPPPPGQDSNAGQGYGGAPGYGYSPQNYQGYGQYYGGAQSPPAAGSAMSPTPDAQQAYAQQWSQYYAQAGGAGTPGPDGQAQDPNADPYAAYGGYTAYMQMYAQYMTQAASGGDMSAAQQGAPGASSPPPPPPSNEQPPPPPPGGAPGGYNAVPPPPGM